MINLKNIHKSFGNLEVLRGIDLHIGKGEIVSIVGPSGAGKTTLLQIMGTLDRQTAGTVELCGMNIDSMSRNELARFRNRKIGFVFQQHQLLNEFTAEENESRGRVALSDRKPLKPLERSGGEQQRLAGARALVITPDIVFADEPSGSLDTRNKEELHKLFFELRERYGQTFVIVTHDEGLASQTDRTIHMRDGLIVEPEGNGEAAV